MSTRILSKIPSPISNALKEMVDQKCNLQRIGEYKSLTLGFGKIENVVTPISNAAHGQWEIITYDCSWRVIKQGKVLCGSGDLVDSIDNLIESFSLLKLGRFVSLEHLSEFDIRVNFSSEMSVDLLCTTSEDDDEILQIFLPNHQVAIFSIIYGWKIGRSDAPWVW
ncbi:MAG: hypothetical protein ACKVH8_05665 [Pirellulales bacterium]